MTDFDDALEQLRADVALPDAAATERIGARLSRNIGAVGPGDVRVPQVGLPAVWPLRLVASFVIGGIVGAGIFGALRPPNVERVYIERPPPLPVPAPSAFPATHPEPEAERAAPPPLASSRSAAPRASASTSGDPLASLAEQQALLDVARAAFARGDNPATLRTLTTHAARFPKSVLAEEREALQIKALAESDRVPEARALAARFRARHPRSLLLPSIKDSVGAIP